MIMNAARRARASFALSTLLFVIVSGSPIFIGSEAFAGSGYLVIEVGKGLKLDGLENAESVFIADPSIADISKSPGNAHFIYGKTPGETTIIASSLSKTTLFSYTLVVIHGVSELRRMISKRFKVENLSLSSARGSLRVSGIVDSELVRENVLTSLKSNVPDSVLIDEMVVRKGNLIRLDVKLVEVARDRLEHYGMDWLALIVGSRHPHSSRQDTEKLIATLKLLTTNGVAAVAAETTLITMNNKKGTFLSGEEVAIPTVTGDASLGTGNVAANFKFVGTDVTVTPVLVPGGRISLEINAGISKLQAVPDQFNGNGLPSFVSRKLATHVEMESGQSLVIGGLSRLEATAPRHKLRDEEFGLLRRLFPGEERQSSQKDFVIVVTPRFDVFDRPTAAGVVRRPQSNLEFVISRRTRTSKSGIPASIHIVGPAGFLY